MKEKKVANEIDAIVVFPFSDSCTICLKKTVRNISTKHIFIRIKISVVKTFQ